jgi:hypothetical protein
VIFRRGEAGGGLRSVLDEASRPVGVVKGGLGMRDRLGWEDFAFLQRGIEYSVDSKKPGADRDGY